MKLNHIPLARVGACIGLVGVYIGSVRLFGYKHVGICKMKCSGLGSRPTRGPSANGFAFW